MEDSFGREISYIRISITDRCNLRCKYCMPENGVQDLGHENILTFESIERIVKASAELGITKVRITGGEPLVRLGVIGLVENLAKIEGIKELIMTTNGTLLSQNAEALKKAGLGRVNISLDSLKHSKYADISRGGKLEEVLEGIEAATKAGLTPIKINVVVIAGFNDDEIEDFAKLTYGKPIEVRFIELMPIGNLEANQKHKFISNEEIKKKLPGLLHCEEQSGVADNFKYPEALGKIGFISPMSSYFCEFCNKIRLTADGKLKPCLHTNQEFDLNQVLKTGDNEMLKEAIKAAILSKGDKHHLNDGARPITRDMNKIGG